MWWELVRVIFILADMYHLRKVSRISTLKVSLSLPNTYQSYLNTTEQTVLTLYNLRCFLDKEINGLLGFFSEHITIYTYIEKHPLN